MKQIGLVTLGSILISVGAMAGGSEKDNVVLKINTDESTVVWTGKKVAGKHYGNVDIKEGQLEIKDGVVSAGKFIMEMQSISNTDLEDAQWNKKLVDHLKSEDFFSVEKYPTSTFVIKEFTPVDNGENETYMVAGELTIKGITKPVSFPASLDLNNSKLVAEGKAKIDRTQYDIKYGSGSFFKGLGDNMIYNDFEIDFKIIADLPEAVVDVAEQ